MSLLDLLAFLNTIRKKIDNYHYQYHFVIFASFFALNYINLPDISILCSWGYLRGDFKHNKTEQVLIKQNNHVEIAKKFERLKLKTGAKS